MIEADRRNGARRRRNHVGRIESAAEANLYDRNRDAARRNSSNAMAVVASKNVGCTRQIAGRAKAVGTIEHVRRFRARRHQRVHSRQTAPAGRSDAATYSPRGCPLRRAPHAPWR